MTVRLRYRELKDQVDRLATALAALEELRQRQVFERRLAGNAGIVVLEPGPIMHCAGGRSPLQHTGARMSRKGRRNAVLERRKRGSTISAFGVAYTRREPHR